MQNDLKGVQNNFETLQPLFLGRTSKFGKGEFGNLIGINKDNFQK